MGAVESTIGLSEKYATSSDTAASGKPTVAIYSDMGIDTTSADNYRVARDTTVVDGTSEMIQNVENIMQAPAPVDLPKAQVIENVADTEKIQFWNDQTQIRINRTHDLLKRATALKDKAMMHEVIAMIKDAEQMKLPCDVAPDPG